jgi:cbb3-type cytochrome c oxidase subunit III
MMKALGFLATATVVAFAACGGDDDTASTAANCDVTSITSLMGNATFGGTTYNSLCGSSACHGATGDGGATNAGHLTELIPMRSTEQIAATVKCGKGAMPAQSQLTAQDIANVVAYVEETF